jgi:antitoxin PrlF
MPKTKTKKTTPRHSPSQIEAMEYRGKQAKTGNSLGFRFDRALFKSHPEFNGEVRAKVIAPGRLLVSAESAASGQHRDDVVVAAFLAFLAKEMQREPQAIAPLDQALTHRIDALVEGVSVSQDEHLGDEALI